MALRQRPGSPTMPSVIVVYRFDCPDCPLGVREGDQPLPSRQPVAETGILRQDRLARCQIAYAAIAEPAAAGRHVAALGDAQLGAGCLYEITIEFRCPGRPPAGYDLPAMRCQRLRRTTGQGDAML